MTESELFKKGLAVRKKVLGEEYVNKSIQNATDFNYIMQELTTEWCWGTIWTREGLPLKVRSLINLSMLVGLGKMNELKIHVKGAIHNGCTINEIKEVLAQATIYCGVPAGVEAFKVAQEALKEEGVL